MNLKLYPKQKDDILKPVGIIQFPGSNCDRDVKKAVKQSSFIFYQDRFNFKDYQAFILPGGFSYGDYLRAGALASHSPCMQDLREAAKKGWPILGICNGFQILCESQLLEGLLVGNQKPGFIDDILDLEVKNKNAHWPGESCSLPIAHGEGRYFISPENLKKLQDQNQIWLVYKDNPNGSIGGIAGVTNKEGNVAGLMPHPERLVCEKHGGTQGQKFFEAITEDY